MRDLPNKATACWLISEQQRAHSEIRTCLACVGLSVHVSCKEGQGRTLPERLARQSHSLTLQDGLNIIDGGGEEPGDVVETALLKACSHQLQRMQRAFWAYSRCISLTCAQGVLHLRYVLQGVTAMQKRQLLCLASHRLSREAEGACTVGSPHDGSLPTGQLVGHLVASARQKFRSVGQAFVFVGDSNNAIQIAELLNQVSQ